MILAIDPDLTKVYQLKEEFNEFYDSTSYKDGDQALRALIRRFRDSNIPEMKMFAGTLSNWFREIVNSLIVIDHEYKVDRSTGEVTARKIHLNNAAIERKNGILKLIKKAGCGHTNWHRFRNRCLYVLRKESTFQLEPIDEPKAQARFKKNKKETKQ